MNNFAIINSISKIINNSKMNSKRVRTFNKILLGSADICICSPHVFALTLKENVT